MFPLINEMMFRIKSWRLRIISRNLLIRILDIIFVRIELWGFLKFFWIEISDGRGDFLSFGWASGSKSSDDWGRENFTLWGERCDILHQDIWCHTTPSITATKFHSSLQESSSFSAIVWLHVNVPTPNVKYISTFYQKTQNSTFTECLIFLLILIDFDKTYIVVLFLFHHTWVDNIRQNGKIWWPTQPKAKMLADSYRQCLLYLKLKFPLQTFFLTNERCFSLTPWFVIVRNSSTFIYMQSVPVSDNLI